MAGALGGFLICLYQHRMQTPAGGSPEEQAEDGEGADVDAAAAQGAEDAAAEPGHQQDGALPEPEVRDGVVRLAFVLPENKALLSYFVALTRCMPQKMCVSLV